MWLVNKELRRIMEGADSVVVGAEVLPSTKEGKKSQISSSAENKENRVNGENVEGAATNDGEQKRWVPSDFSLGNLIAKGSFGSYYLVKAKNTETVVVMKILFKAQIQEQNLKPQVIEEIEIHTHLRHVNIARMYGWFDDKKRVYMILEYAPGSDLLTKMERQPLERFKKQHTVVYVRQLIEAVRYVHGRKIIHRDLKLRNMLLDKDGILKLSGFDWAVKAPRAATFAELKVRSNSAPEMVLNKPYDYSVDLWAIGCVCYHMLTGQCPFSEQSARELRKSITAVDLSLPRFINTDAHDLISKLIVFDPSRRLSLDQIAAHHFLKKE